MCPSGTIKTCTVCSSCLTDPLSIYFYIYNYIYIDDLMICKLSEMQLSTVMHFCGLFTLLLVSGQTDGTIEQDEQRTRGRQNRGRSLGRGRLNLRIKIQEILSREGTPNSNYMQYSVLIM